MKNIYDLFKISLLSIFVTFLSVSCSKDDNKVTPPTTQSSTTTATTTSTTTATTEEFVAKWSRLEVRFTKGHSHGYFHGNPDYPVKYLKTVQRFYFENKNGVITPANDNPTAIRWEGSNDQAGVSLSGIELIFYDKEGKRINSLLTTGQAPNHYQFFFIADNFTAVASNTTVPTQAEALQYKYRDTNPEELYIKGGAGIDNNPNAPKGVLRKEQIGLKGFFEIKRAYVNFNLHIVLGYFATKPAGLTYSTLPANKVMEVKVPIHIYHDIIAEDKQIEDAVREFGVSKDEIEKDYNDILSSDLSPESSGTFL
ncbi:hypothetical protein [Capnocytophaga sputigena]|jgi:hypothetical protein|uniref:Uncharacterized protein n=1 Tax=Capnocytophaga sputigena TaxID=1019 RepID=A0A2A3N2A1_CAPSP|nr:hypothetical protein [Capnocytophaga sputigena]ATA71561.1 hypothetical protein CGC57_11880 [Capnocytophaga sputigena]ATA80569.1 hypothetical protein CGC59_13180 [Capnocytophaga sputigena]PBN45885.1 hypothetical protein CDC50_07565 [Capnocytophaga sputigena]